MNNEENLFKEFESCDQESFVSYLYKYKDQEWNLSDFGSLLYNLSKNKEITNTEKCKLLTKTFEYKVNINGENKVFQFKFTDELIGVIYMLVTSGIDENTCQNIANIINNLSKVGLTSKDLYFNDNMSFIEEVVTLINNIFNSEINKSGYNFNSQDIANTLNGLAQLGYKQRDLKGLNISGLTEQINNRIDNFNSQGISNTINGLAKLGYRKKDLKDLNIGGLIEQINNQIKDFIPQGIANTLLGLGKIGYNFDELKENNVIQNLLKKFNSIQKNKIVLSYLILMKGLVATVYNIKQDNLDEEQKQYLNKLKETISGDVEQIVKEAKEKRKEITNATNLHDLKRMLIILEDHQQAGLKQQTKKVIKNEQRFKINIRRFKKAKMDIMKGELCATAEANKATTNNTVLQK